MAARRKSRKKAAGDGNDTDNSNTAQAGGSSQAVRIYWDKDATRTDRLLDWLDDNPADRQKLFSDSSQDARVEGRKRRVAKGSKTHFYTRMAAAVFSVDAKKDIRDNFGANPDKYAKSVENQLGTYVLHSSAQLSHLTNLMIASKASIASSTPRLDRQVQD